MIEVCQWFYFGIKEGNKAHRMFNPQSNKIMVSRDVVFEETEIWSWDAAKVQDFSEIVEGERSILSSCHCNRC